jgi:DedD protein
VDKQLQQRLTGAAIIVALAVIFIPEMVEQPEPDRTPAPAPALSPPSDMPTTTISMDPPEEPLAPEVAIDGSGDDEPGSDDTISAELPELPPLAEADAPLEDVAPVGTELPFDQPEPVIEEPPPVAATRAPEPPPPAAPARPPVSRAEPPAPRQPDPPPRRESPPTPPPERVAAIAPPPEPALPKLELISRPMGQGQAQSQPRWMVQAGSFSDVDNANSLRDRLRSSNFSASLQQTVVDGRTMYRVHVGPHSSRDESERTRERLRRELNINGSVIPVYN